MYVMGFTAYNNGERRTHSLHAPGKNEVIIAINNKNVDE
jgi:hypothetical protein